MMTMQGLFARRAAAAAITNIGCGELTLRRPATAIATDADELGLNATGFTETTLKPVLIENTRSTATNVSIAAEVLEKELALNTPADIAKSLTDAASIVINNTTYFITDVQPITASGATTLYRLTLRATRAAV